MPEQTLIAGLVVLTMAAAMAVSLWRDRRPARRGRSAAHLLDAVPHPEAVEGLVRRLRDAGPGACAVVGAAGTGTSHVAAEVARRLQADGVAGTVVTVDGRTRASLIDSLALAGPDLGVAPVDDDPVGTALQVGGALAAVPGRALLVVDGVLDERVLQGLLPDPAQVPTLIAAHVATALPVTDLQVRVHRLARAASVELLTSTGGVDHAAAVQLATHLDDHPLAVAEAARALAADPASAATLQQALLAGTPAARALPGALAEALTRDVHQVLRDAADPVGVRHLLERLVAAPTAPAPVAATPSEVLLLGVGVTHEGGRSLHPLYRGVLPEALEVPDEHS